MIIEILDNKGKILTDFDLEFNPYKTGETINIQVRNYDTNYWAVENLSGNFIIDKIEHFIRKDFTRNKVKVVCTVCIVVSPV